MRWMFCLLVALTSCTPPSREITDFNRVGSTINQRLQAENNLYLFGLGYLGPGKFKGIDLSLDSPTSADIPEARRQMVSAVQKIVDTVNQDPLFLEDLDEVPFASKHLLLSLNFAPSPEGLTKAIIAHAKIAYYVDDPATGRSKKIFQETFEEALKEIQNVTKE